MNTEIRTQDNHIVSLQITKFGSISPIEELGTEFEFDLNGESFLVKNDSEEAIEVSVIPALSLTDENGDEVWVNTVFQPGWNPEWVRVFWAEGGSWLWGK